MGIGVYRLVVMNLSTQYNVVFNFYEAWRKIMQVAFCSFACGVAVVNGHVSWM